MAVMSFLTVSLLFALGLFTVLSQRNVFKCGQRIGTDGCEMAAMRVAGQPTSKIFVQFCPKQRSRHW